MFASDHLKIHGFSSSGRFLTTYRKDYGALRERYPQLNSSSTEVERAPSFTGPLQPPSSSFLPARVPSSDIRTTSISLATQDVASILSEDQTQDAGVAGDAQRLLGKEGEAQCHHGYVENVWQQQEAKDTKTEIIYKEGVVAVSSSDGLPSCNDFLIHLLKENGLQHLLDTPSGWTPVVTNKDDKHWDKSAHLWVWSTPLLQNPTVQCSRCARGPECFELKTICQSSALPQARVQPATYHTEARRKLL